MVNITVNQTVMAEINRQKLKEERDAKIAAPIQGVQVASVEDRENIQGTIRKWETLGNPPAIPWTMADNSVSLLTKDDLIAIEDAYTLRKAQAFQEYQALTGV